jgi:hypothetical protein
MAARVAQVRKPQDPWNKFRPVAVQRQQKGPRQGRAKLLLIFICIVAISILVARLLRPHVERGLARMANRLVTLERGEMPATPGHAERRTPAARVGRRPLHSAREHSASQAAPLGDFDAYILQGDRYVRVQGMSKYALVDMDTGKIIWIAHPK